MALGEGKYDHVLTAALRSVGAQQGVLIVLDGDDGIGFSIQADVPRMIKLPGILEQVATSIRRDLPQIFEGLDDGKTQPE